MKFAYVDESGRGQDLLVMVAVIADAQRMHVTKSDWLDFLEELERLSGRRIPEFHAADFYSGNSPWRAIAGPDRAALITHRLRWLAERKHAVTYAAVLSQVFIEQKNQDARLDALGTPWRAAAFHLALSMQKHHRRLPKNKGNTIVIFDRQQSEEGELTSLMSDPPGWSDDYYGRARRERPLDQIVDVPFFAASHEVLLIQMADLVAFLLRRYAELRSGARPAYPDEQDRVSGWIELIRPLLTPSATRYPQRSRTSSQDLFYRLAPDCLRDV